MLTLVFVASVPLFIQKNKIKAVAAMATSATMATVPVEYPPRSVSGLCVVRV
jgi:hypothetical protein